MRNNEKRGRDEEKKEREEGRGGEGRCDDRGKTERKSKN
jgi:hypothetical protein